MTHLSPAVFLVWSLCAIALTTFCIYHLWCYDRFKCLRWNAGPYAGSFKRLMTYTYLMSLPLLTIFSIGMAILKYSEGFVDIPGFGILPKPYFWWSPSHKDAILPLMLMLSLLWSTEATTHLEELCFWLFLMNASSSQPDWFRSPYFKIWVVGSFACWIYMPFATLYTRADPLHCEAATFMAGSLGSLIHTLWFIPILWSFPKFLDTLEKQGVDEKTIIRLTRVSEMNLIRLIFRLLYLVPIVIVSSDGLRHHKHINENMFATDLLAIIAGLGCSVQSAITVVIFFPRDRSAEYRKNKLSRSPPEKSSNSESESSVMMRQELPTTTVSSGPSIPPKQLVSIHDDDEEDDDDDVADDTYEMPSMYVQNTPTDKGRGNSLPSSEGWRSPEGSIGTMDPLVVLQPNRRSDIEAYPADPPKSKNALKRLANPKSWVHPLIKNFDSPLEMAPKRRRRQ